VVEYQTASLGIEVAVDDAARTSMSQVRVAMVRGWRWRSR